MLCDSSSTNASYFTFAAGIEQQQPARMAVKEETMAALCLTAPDDVPEDTIRDIQRKFLTTRQEMINALIERDEEIDLVLTALLAQEHCLLVGPPGTGKSLLLDSLLTWTEGNRFTILFTKFTTPEEVFGPISLSGLKEDKFRRVITGKLPEADYLFADEVFKASSAILNTLLRILNERTYDKGDGILMHCPLKLAVAASNETPSAYEGGKELAAVFDRFLLRKKVRPIIRVEGRQRLLWERDHNPKLSTKLSTVELELVTAYIQALAWTAEAKNALHTILRELSREGVVPGDRRQYKSVAATQAYAFLAGADRVEPEHLEILSHILWDDPEEQPQKAASIVAKVANPTGMKVNSLLKEAEDVVQATDPRNIGQAGTAIPKLEEILKQLAALPDSDPRVKKAEDIIGRQIKSIKKAAIEGL
jgi:MoxR-like ATPase